MTRKEVENATLSQLMERNRQLVQRMNERISSFSKANESSYALKLMEDFLEKQGLTKYTTSVKKIGGINELREQVIHLEKVDKMQTATLKGARTHFRRSLRSLGLESMLKEESKAQSDFKTFLESDAWKEIKDYDSERIYEVADALEQGNTWESLKEKWNEYEAGEIDLDEVVDKWVAVNEDFNE